MLVGVVTRTGHDKYEERIASVWPLFEAKGSSWEPVRDHEQEFPPRGNLFWPRAQNFDRGALVQFRSKENNVRKEGGDDFMVVDPRPVHEVIDLRRYGDCEGVRRALAAGIPGVPAGRHLVWCEGNRVVGPVQLILNSTGETTLDRNNRAQIGCFEFTSGEILTFTSEDGPRAVVIKMGQPQSFVDWDEDALVLRRAVKHAVESSSSAQFPRQAIDEFAERLVRDGASSENRLEQYRFERLRGIAKSAAMLRDAREEVVQFLLKHPVVVAELTAAREAEAERVRVETEAALRGAREEAARLEKRSAELLAANKDASQRLSEVEAKVAKECADAERKVQERLSVMLRDAPGLLAEVSLLKPFFGKQDEVASPAPVLYPAWKRDSKPITNPTELRRRFIGAFKSFGIEPATYQPIHATFVGGLLPVLGGSRAVEALQAYAHVVAGGRCAVVQVTSAVADVQDVFGRVVQGRFVPEASGLIDIVRAANSSTGLFVVVLEGINRGPTESYLLPLIRSAVRRSGEISLFHPMAVSSNDPYRGEARFRWPENLLVAATVLEGPTTLPVAPDLWADGAYVEVQVGPRGGVPGEAGDISPELFQPDLGKVDVEWMKEFLPSAQGTAFRFESGLRTVVNDGLRMAVARAVVVPVAASLADEAERLQVCKEAERELGASIEEVVAAARRRLT